MEWKDYLEKIAVAKNTIPQPTPQKDKEQLRKIAAADEALKEGGASFEALAPEKAVGLMQDLGISADDYVHLQEAYPDGIPEDVFQEDGAAAASAEAGKEEAAAPAAPQVSEEDKALLERINTMSSEEWESFASGLSDEKANHVMNLMGIDKQKVAAQLEIYNNAVISGMGMFDGWSSAQARMEKLASQATPVAPAKPDVSAAVNKALGK